MDWNGHLTTAGWILSALWTIFIIALVIAAIVWLVTALTNRHARSPSSGAPGPSAREILDRRLASGELSVEKYTQLRDAISDPAPRTRPPGPGVPAGT